MTGRLLAVCTLCLITACSMVSGPSGGRYTLKNDGAPRGPVDLSSIPRVVPVAEERTAAGNKSPYTVNGLTYYVRQSEAGYEERGLASWYGRKFHGHRTSNGEIYNMYRISAAHKTLPIPSYLEVTNLENGKSLVVRVNDRGPFHSERIIDLSYAAASLLGFADKGTARVRLKALIPGQQSRPVLLAQTETRRESLPAGKLSADNDSQYLQIGAFSSLEMAQAILARLADVTNVPAFIRSDLSQNSNSLLHRVRLGPISETVDLQILIQGIMDAGLGTPFRVVQ